MAALYDLFCPWEERDDLEFYLGLVMSSEAVLDVGCGTGMLLHRARELGHTGRLTGLDPAAGMLEQARRRDDVEWVLGDLATVAWAGEFDLVVMSGHAFQVLVSDEELEAALATITAALTGGGRFAFETRNPGVETWREWTPANAVEVVDASGTRVRMSHEVSTPLDGELVSFTTTYTSPSWDGPRLSSSTLRFLDAVALGRFLEGAGLVAAEQYGDWARGPLEEKSREIITIARHA